MEQIINYVKPELVVVSIALYFLGMWMKNSKRIKDNDIPIFLGIVGIIICGLYVIATCDLSGMQNISMALFTAVVHTSIRLSSRLERTNKYGNKYD